MEKISSELIFSFLVQILKYYQQFEVDSTAQFYTNIISYGWLAAFSITFIFFVLKLIYEIFYFKNYYYAENPELLSLRKGVFGINTLTIPYNKIQHIFIDQDLFDRLFGLWDVHVASAGTTGMQLHIDGLRAEHAQGLRNLLIQRTIK